MNRGRQATADVWINDLVGGDGALRIDAPTLAVIADKLDIDDGSLGRVARGLVRSYVSDAAVSALDMRTNTWRIDVPTSIAKSVLCGSVTATVLQSIGADAIPPTVLALVAPFLFEIERVELNISDVVLHATLADAAAGQPLHIGDLYERLPETIRAELSVSEFGNLLDRLVAARLATVGPEGVRLKPAGRLRGFRLLLR